jgi:hypothetical protein
MTKLAGRYAACAALLVTSFVLMPLLALAGARLGLSWVPRQVSNLLFFWPQYFLLPNGLATRATGAAHLAGSAPYLFATFWLAVMAGYVWVTRRLATRYVLIAMLPIFGALLQVVLALVSAAFGLSVVLDGP